MKFYRLNLSTDVEYEAARALVDGALGYSGDLTCISPYATAPVDQKGRVLLSLTDNQPGYLSLVYQFGLLVTAKKAKELTQDEYDQSFAPAPTGSGGGVSSWNDLTDRPFTSLGSGVTVVSGALTVPTYDRRSDTVSSVSYIGRAPTGSATSASVWSIKKTTIAANGTVSSSLTATNVKWDDRLTATYS